MDTPTHQPFDQLIFLIRGHKVMLSTDLARLYEVRPKALIQAVKRNLERFPDDFMFKLNATETKIWKSQLVTSNSSRSQLVTLKRGENIKYAPYAFTEQGVAMLSTVLKSPRAIRINIAIMRAFVKIRETLSLHKELASQLRALERRISDHDAQIQTVFDAITALTKNDPTPPRKIGFTPEDRSVGQNTRRRQ